MFKLNRLEITGFKSFADHTEIVFTGNGITGVVGPNGCGKSNVSDAISWVLGEQRAKSLRGAEMKDVVFQGTKNRKPSGMAEVVLHMVRDDDFLEGQDEDLDEIDAVLGELDEHSIDVDALEAETLEVSEAVAEANGNLEPLVEVETLRAAQVGSIQTVERVVKTKRHWRPRSVALDFAPGESVSITRRLYLSGESEYQLNGKTCRLRDIQDLFAGTGLSGSHYAIIEQGRIGQILSAKPGDRRTLIEEAAGISKFRTRQRAAESRLETAKSNLSRISDIVSEIEKQANSLRRQAGKTRRFIALQEEFRSFQRQYFAAEGRYFDGLIESLKTELASAAEKEQDLIRQVSEMEGSAKAATQATRTEEEALAAIRQRHADSELERDREVREHRYQSEQLVEFGNRSQALKNDIEAIEERLGLIVSERERLEKEEVTEREGASAAETILLEAEGLFATKIADVRLIEGTLESRRNELLQHTAAAERFAETARQLEINRDRILERITGLSREEVRAAESHAEHIAEAERVAAELKTHRERIEGLLAEKAAFMVQADGARANLRDADQTLKETQNEHSRIRHRLETLRELDGRRAVYAPEVQRLFAEAPTIGIELKGVLADFMRVSPTAEKAVEKLFGHSLQTVIVGSADEARKVSDWLAHQEDGRIATLIAGDISLAVGDDPSSDENSIAGLMGVSAELGSLLADVFPREMAARLVDELSNDNVGHETLVDHDGNILIGGKLLISGRGPTEEQNASLLAFKRELTTLGETIMVAETTLQAAESVVEQRRAELASVEEKAVDLQSLIIKVERGIVTLEGQETVARQDIERAERHRKVVGDEIVQAKGETEEVAARIEEARTAATAAAQEQTVAQSDLDEISIALVRAREVSENENAALNQKRTLAATSEERRRAAASALRRVENEQKELESRRALQDLELGETASRIESLRSTIGDLATNIAGSGSRRETEKEELSSALGSLTASRTKADDLSAQLAELNHNAADAMNERSAIEIRRTEAITDLKNLNEKCFAELSSALTEVVNTVELAEDFDLTEARQKVSDLRQRLDSFGAINMLAVEELEEAEERLLFLSSQRQDIIDSIASTEEALQEIKERSRQRFVKAFHAINENFAEFFQELFGGGRGEMSLLDSEDVLDAGIEVVAQPPGKRLQNILLLSGGEKAMTAIALVMAIFKYRPSPFCLLDEVDAPLDEANVGRFVNKIAGMSENTQFIVITHNKRTMEAARALYGVTMQEAGVSKIVSVKFE